MSVADVAWRRVNQEPVPPAASYCKNQGAGDSILIYLSISGLVIPMRVLEELARNDSLVKDYGIKGGNVLHLVLKLSDLLLITVRTSCGKEFELHVDRNRNVGYLKQRIAREGKGFVDVNEQEIFCNGEKVDDQRLVEDLFIAECDSDELRGGIVGGERDKPEGLQIVTQEQSVRDFWLEPVLVNPRLKLPSFVWDMIDSTFEGLLVGNRPIRSSEGTGGTYFMQDKSGFDYVSIFKPIDEEPMAVNNPQGLPVSTNGEGLKMGTRVGEGALREVAAYILDHPKSGPRSLSSEMLGFAGVPPTCMVQCLHEGFNHPDGYGCSPENVKVGSLQMFINNSGSCEDIGPGAFPVEEVHKITVFDIRMANADRHAGNILIGKGTMAGLFLFQLIMATACLSFEDCTFDWLYWPQSRQPYSSDTIAYIKSLDPEQDIALLKSYGLDVPLECARTLHISTMLLKKGVERGLTPFAIGSIMCRENINKESAIEQMVREAWDSLLPGVSEAAFIQSISEIMDTWLDKLNLP
ncbi:Phosphatidylinositol 4-kinase gamma 4 [Hibiscus syriacus]|uniref:1-phosphatidylinositol 4-kinase n=1 Tax=Hibiscus syriacus TaxID=106335 RepID=A0A6A3B672_HIBSY|nr:Phosphatidylinositol 4-kinase gamma 4 [Hibiscus syriacus]